MRSYQVAVRQAHGVGLPLEMHYADRQGQPAVETFHAYGEPSSLTLSQFSILVDVDATEIKPEHIALVANILSECFGNEEEYSRFSRFVRTQRVDDETLLDVLTGLIEDCAGRPTERSSSSSAGPSTTGPISRAASSLPEVAPVSQTRPPATVRDFVVVEGFGGLDELEQTAYSA